MSGNQDGKPLVVILNPSGHQDTPEVREILERAGCRVAARRATGEEEIISAVRDAEGLIGSGPLTRRVMESLERCRVIARNGIGMDRVEGIDIATRRGTVVCNCPGVFEEEVADHTMALLLAAARFICPAIQSVRDGRWQAGKRPRWPILRLRGAVLGLVGLGNIGSAVALRARGFGMRLLASDPYIDPQRFEEFGARHVPLAQLLEDSDIVSLHVPLTDETRHLIGAPELGLMRPTSILINTCRGAVVDEPALVAALSEGRIAAAGLDVMESEPISPDHPLCELENVVITPHMASNSTWADRQRHIRPALEVAAVLSGHRPRAVWNPEVFDRLSTAT